jgi:hypothetical protein
MLDDGSQDNVLLALKRDCGPEETYDVTCDSVQWLDVGIVMEHDLAGLIRDLF